MLCCVGARRCNSSIRSWKLMKPLELSDDRLEVQLPPRYPVLTVQCLLCSLIRGAQHASLPWPAASLSRPNCSLTWRDTNAMLIMKPLDGSSQEACSPSGSRSRFHNSELEWSEQKLGFLGWAHVCPRLCLPSPLPGRAFDSLCQWGWRTTAN